MILNVYTVSQKAKPLFFCNKHINYDCNSFRSYKLYTIYYLFWSSLLPIIFHILRNSKQSLGKSWSQDNFWSSWSTACNLSGCVRTNVDILSINFHSIASFWSQWLLLCDSWIKICSYSAFHSVTGRVSLKQNVANKLFFWDTVYKWFTPLGMWFMVCESVRA